MCVCVCVCVCVSMCVCTCVYMCALLLGILTKYHQLTVQANNYKQLVVTEASQKQNNNKKKQTKNIHSGGRWNLISYAGKPENDRNEIPETVALVIK